MKPENSRSRQACLMILAAALIFIQPAAARAEIIFSDDFGSWPDYVFEVDDWEPPGGWTLADGANSGFSEDFDGVTHHCGEVTAPGREGDEDRAFKVWRHGAFFYDYCGELHYAEENLHNYVEIYNRWTMKIPSDFTLAEDDCHMNYLKMWRYIVGDSTGCILANWCGPGAYEIYLNINGASFSGASMQIGKSIDPGAGWHTLLDVSEVRDGLWHSFELRIRLNDPDQANGEIQFWLDGEERASFTGLDYGATAVDAFSKAALGIGNTGARDCSPQGTFQEPWRAIEYDDFVISDSYIGPVDAEPPDEDAPEEVEEISPEPADAWESAADAVEDPPPADAVSDAADASSDPVGEEEAATSNDGCGCRLVG